MQLILFNFYYGPMDNMFFFSKFYMFGRVSCSFVLICCKTEMAKLSFLILLAQPNFWFGWVLKRSLEFILPMTPSPFSDTTAQFMQPFHGCYNMVTGKDSTRNLLDLFVFEYFISEKKRILDFYITKMDILCCLSIVLLCFYSLKSLCVQIYTVSYHRKHWHLQFGELKVLLNS